MMNVPFFRPAISRTEIEAVSQALSSGWLTTGGRTREFEAQFAAFVGAKHAVALNSCTAALHLALEAVGVQRGDLVLVPTHTFAATAEVVRYFDATPVLVDSEPDTLCIAPERARETLSALQRGEPTAGLSPPYGPVRAIIPVHYGGQMAEVAELEALAKEFDIALIEDAAHTVPARYRAHTQAPWRDVGTTALISCFSFYANKCITTGEGGMAVTDRDDHAARMRVMALHGLSKDAWKRFEAGGNFRYEIIAPGFKYNLTDIASALGIEQLKRAEEFWSARQRIARTYSEALRDVEGLELPRELPNRQHSWHLYAVRVKVGAWPFGRDTFIEQLSRAGIGCSVHWMPLHMHPYYRDKYGYQPELFPVAHRAWDELVSLPIFPSMSDAELEYVITTIRAIRAQSVRR